MFKRFLILFLAYVPTSLFASDLMPKTLTITATNSVVMDMEYTDETVAKVTLAIQDLNSKLPYGEPIYLLLVTPGGSVEAGLELIDNLQGMNRTVHAITVFAASMGFHNSQGVSGQRYITQTGTLMAHKARGGFEGEFPGQLTNRLNYYLKRLEKLDEKVVSRSDGKYTLESFQAAYENELWCQGNECVKLGLADEMINVSCDSSLNGTKTTTIDTDFMGIPVEITLVKAACPTIKGVLSFKVKISGEETSLEDNDKLFLEHNLSPEKILALRRLVEKKVEEFAPFYSQSH